MSRHVAHVRGRGFPTPARARRQRVILDGLTKAYPSLPEGIGGAPPALRPRLNFAFSMRESPQDAAARLSQLLDGVDPDWRDYVLIQRQERLRDS